MKFEYTGRHIEVTPALRSHVEEHFDRIEHLFGKDDNHAHIIIEVEHGKHNSEIIVKGRNQVLTATAASEDMYLSLSQSIAKIEKQALKLKNKIIDKSHKAKKISEVITKDDLVESEPDSPRIISVENYSVKPMTADEAVMKLDQVENQFLVFRNALNEDISVIYKRKDGNYGLIEP
ncbi:MAG: ribosome-associated translation inhibitor RaiA [Acidobacteriota bacterium]|jgi:putative sigma-54 modulation protein|nr:ribosome-associated translation inhibitor RaiA [Acidobacteriota bacterium]